MKTTLPKGDRERQLNSTWRVPAFLFLLTLLVYGPFLPALGYSWDDWPVISLLRNGGDLRAFYAYDRPFSFWTYSLTGPVLGLRPLNWHVFTLLMRWLGSVGFWWVVTQLWPNARRKALIPVLLFTVHPAFTLQPIAVAFSQHFITLGLFMFSLGAMLRAQTAPRGRRLYTAAALASQALHMMTMEYLWGLELVRPILLWRLPARERPRRERLQAWLPYLGIQAAFLAWRFLFLELPAEDPNALALLELYRSNFTAGLLHSLNIVFRDIVYVLYKSWTTALGPGLIDAADRSLLFSWFWVLLIAGASFWFIERTKKGQPAPTDEPFYLAAMKVGSAALILSLLPSWITDNEITSGLFSSRFALPALFGGSLFVAGFFDMLLRLERFKFAWAAVLVGLAAGVHFRNANNFRWDWVKQERFFRQFTTRVPALDSGTAVFSEGAIFGYTGGYPTALAINAIYPADLPYPEQAYWFFELDDTYAADMQAFLNGAPAVGSLRNLRFEGSTQAGLAIYYEPDTGSCLRVLTQDQADLPDLPELTAAAASISDVQRIHPNALFDEEAFAQIFGKQEQPTWCRLYQEAELARQQEDWETVARLRSEAGSLGLAPNDPFEWFPFIEADARLGNWEAAGALAAAAFRHSQQTRDRPAFCELWDSLPEEDPTNVRSLLGCE